MTDEKHVFTMRLDGDLVPRLDEYAERVEKKESRGRTIVLNKLIRRALDDADRKAGRGTRREA